MNYKYISGPQVARHVILCASQSKNPQQHTLGVMQILYSQCCAGFATNVPSDEGFTCAVNYLLIVRQFYLIACNIVLPEKLPVSQLASKSHGLYKPLFNREEAAVGLGDEFVYKETEPKFMCRTAS